MDLYAAIMYWKGFGFLRRYPLGFTSRDCFCLIYIVEANVMYLWCCTLQTSWWPVLLVGNLRRQSYAAIYRRIAQAFAMSAAALCATTVAWRLAYLCRFATLNNFHKLRLKAKQFIEEIKTGMEAEKVGRSF